MRRSVWMCVWALTLGQSVGAADEAERLVWQFRNSGEETAWEGNT